MTIMQDIRFDKYNFQFKGFTYLYESDSEIEEDEANFSAPDEEWVEDNEEEDDRTQEKTIPDLADHALVLAIPRLGGFSLYLFLFQKAQLLVVI